LKLFQNIGNYLGLIIIYQTLSSMNMRINYFRNDWNDFSNIDNPANPQPVYIYAVGINTKN